MNAVPAPSPLRVVVIDDTSDLRDLLRIALTRGGYDVVAEAGDGRAGIEAARQHRPDVILLDLAMPVMDGVEALPSLRRLCPAATIVVLSGFGATQMADRAVAAGADGYVQKGAPLRSILTYVDGIVSDGGAPPALRSLSVVEAPVGPSAELLVPRAEPAPRADENAERDPAGAAALEAVRLAPYGFLELADDPLLRVVHANPQAARLLGTDQPGTPLATASPDLADLVARHRLDGDAAFMADLAGGRVRATLRRSGSSLLVYLDSTAEDVGLLRRAIATTAHEVRGPVAVLCGVAETLAWEGNRMPPEQNLRLLGSVARQARILDRITADLLTTAQVQRGSLRVDLIDVATRPLIENAVADRWEIDLVVEDPRPVRADPLRLEQMLTNLLSNAQKYGAAPFGVRVRPDGEHVCIDVSDRGVGVPEEFRPRLFDEFARAQGAVATGTGLGLYVVRTLARAQAGDVSFAPGLAGGSVFTVRLPAG